MIFSAEKWNTEDGVRMIIHASNALSFETMQGPLNQAWSHFLVPMFGQELCSRIEQIYNSSSRKDVESQALRIAQTALINLALYESYTELNVRLTDQGHQRQETENFKSLYKYQENDIRNSYRNKGFNSLDSLAEFFAATSDTFTEWEASPANVERKNAIVRSTKEVDEVVFINHSSIIFLRLKPIFNKIEQTDVPIMIGQRLYDKLKTMLSDTTQRIGTTTVEELRVRLTRVIVARAIAELVRQTGSLTDRGLYFESVTAGREGTDVLNPQKMEESMHHSLVYDRIADAQQQQLTNFIAYYIPEFFGGREEDVFKRDNDGKRTVWL